MIVAMRTLTIRGSVHRSYDYLFDAIKLLCEAAHALSEISCQFACP